MVALRESSTKSGQAADLGVVTGRSEGDGGVPHGAFLLDLAGAVARWQWDAVAELREEGKALLGAQETSDAILVAAGFNGITRVADAIGIRLDARTDEASVDLRPQIGIDAFAPGQQVERCGGVGQGQQGRLSARLAV